MNGNCYDFRGHRWGLLESLAIVTDKRTRHPIGVLFRCDCGKYRKVSIRAIRKARVPETCKRCEKEWDQQIVAPKPIPLSQQYLSEYRSWKRDKKVFCKRWCESFEAFLKDMGPRPKGLALCRYNRKALHSPENTYWGNFNEDRGKPIKWGSGTIAPLAFSKKFGIRLSFVYSGREKRWTGEKILEEWRRLYG